MSDKRHKLTSSGSLGDCSLSNLITQINSTDGHSDHHCDHSDHSDHHCDHSDQCLRMQIKTRY